MSLFFIVHYSIPVVQWYYREITNDWTTRMGFKERRIM